MDAIHAITTRAGVPGPVRPVPAAKPVVTSSGRSRALQLDHFARSQGAAPDVTYGRDGKGGS